MLLFQPIKDFNFFSEKKIVILKNSDILFGET